MLTDALWPEYTYLYFDRLNIKEITVFIFVTDIDLKRFENENITIILKKTFIIELR